MGSVYIATCHIEGNPWSNYFKIGSSPYDNPIECINGVASKPTDECTYITITHKCCAYFISKDYELIESIEKSLNKQLKKWRINNIKSWLDSKDSPHISKTHYKIPKREILATFKVAINPDPEKHLVKYYPCPGYHDCRFYSVIPRKGKGKETYK